MAVEIEKKKMSCYFWKCISEINEENINEKMWSAQDRKTVHIRENMETRCGSNFFLDLAPAVTLQPLAIAVPLKRFRKSPSPSLLYAGGWLFAGGKESIIAKEANE